MNVESATWFARFVAASLLIHALLLLTLPGPRKHAQPPQTLTVSLLPPPRPAMPPASRTPGTGRVAGNAPSRRAPAAAPTRPSKAPAIIAKRNSPVLEERLVEPKQSFVQEEPVSEPPPLPQEPPRRDLPVREKIEITERQLPTLKELLPPVGWSSSAPRRSGQDGPVLLNTRNPQYITYFGSIKRAIELVWQYPEPALRYGLQGKLLLEFAILGNGELASARIVRSSGSHLLDEEALRAVKAAAPFKPIPPWIDKQRLDIIASFEYHDNRLDYRFMR